MGEMIAREGLVKSPQAGRAIRDRRSGSVLMEFVLTMPILVTLVMLILQFAQVWVARQMVAYSAFCAARSMLSCNPVEWVIKNSTENGAYQAARRALSWVTIMGRSDTRHLRGWEEESLDFGVGDFSDVGDGSTETFTTIIYGSKATHDVLVPGWGQVPESNSVDLRLELTPRIVQGRYVSAEVKYKFPLLMPVAAQLIATGECDGFPCIDLTETCVLPLPYSTAQLPLNAYDYTSYD